MKLGKQRELSAIKKSENQRAMISTPEDCMHKII
jgi:hypothetical protein